MECRSVPRIRPAAIDPGELNASPVHWVRGCSILESMELIFEVRDAEEGGFYARALGHAVFTQAETWEELRANAIEVAALHFEDEAVQPRLIQLHYVKDELIPLEAA
jgi:predicted RNase H-like HicB family nuclease